MISMRKIFIILAVALATSSYAAEPSGYYTSCENKNGAALLSALSKVVGPHTTVSYDGLWDLYKTSDVKPNGKLWDMYSTKEWTPGREQCGNYKLVGDCVNREHSFPKSWFSKASPMYSDAFHLYPTDGKVNGQRSNYPYGECAGGTTLPSNGSIKALGRLGTSTFPGYSGTVFEPVDEYKGDFARSYFYMAAAYNSRISGWSSDMLAGNAYPAFKSWAVDLLLKWHRQDPVSQKELDRQEAVYARQHNRNPFIDHPELAEYIWGDSKNTPWSLGAGQQPTLSTPVDGSTVDLGNVGVGVPRSMTISVKGSDLANAVTATISGAGWTVSPASLTAASVNNVNGANLAVTYTATTAGVSTATLRLASGSDVTSTVTLCATAFDGLPASNPTNITAESFIAHWTYVGGEDSNGCYTLVVQYPDGTEVDTYPRSVPARDEQFLVDELAAETEYRYYIESETMRSNVISVTTGVPLPMIQIMYDGDLFLESEPGVPGEAVELLVDIDNITTDINLSVDAPFELSSDKSNWDTNLVIDSREDRIYIRINGDTEGRYDSSIRAVAGDYTNDDAEVTGRIAAIASFLEDFENEGTQTGNYSTVDYVGHAVKWKLSDAGVFQLKNEAYDGDYYLRMGSTATSTATMDEDKAGGVGIVTLYAAGWSAKDGSSEFALDYSTDGGQTWNEAGAAKIAQPESSTKTYEQYTFTVNRPGNVRLRIRQTFGKRMCIDNIAATNYTNSVDDITFGDDQGHGWDAYSLDGQLVIELDKDATVAVHGTDGVTRFVETFAAGTTVRDLEPGLYIVVVGESTRRVLVK